MLTRLYQNGLYLPASLRRGASALWRETDGGGGWPCCCPRGAGSSRSFTSCSNCIGSLAPPHLQIDLSGFPGSGSSTCANCSDLNGTYVLPRISPASPGCVYAADMSFSCNCGTSTGYDGIWATITAVKQLSVYKVQIGVKLISKGTITSGAWPTSEPGSVPQIFWRIDLTSNIGSYVLADCLTIDATQNVASGSLACSNGTSACTTSGGGVVVRARSLF